MALTLRFAVRSDVGHVREGNEDSAFAGPRLLAIADGMGGAAAGEVASQVAIASLAHLDEDAPGGDLLAELALALRAANERLRQLSAADPSLDGMGTTVTALLSAGSRLGMVHIGDSRAYLLRDGELSQITRDHTLVQQLVDEGQITAEEAGNHPQRSLILRALDGRGEVDLDLSLREAMVGDRYLLCSDGLSGVVSLETIRATLDMPDPQAAVDRLVELALRGGGPDNVTVVVADIIDELDGSRTLAAQVAGAASPEQASTGSGDTAAARAAVLRSDGGSARPAVAAPSFAPAGPPAPPVGAFAGRGTALDSRSDQAADPGAAGLHASSSTASLGRRRRLAPMLARPAVLLPLALLLVLVLGGASAWAYVQSQYLVGADDGRVVVFRGVNGSFAGLSLHHVVHRSDVRLDQLADLDQQMVRAGITAHGRADAEGIVARLAGRARPAEGACPSPPPTVSATPTPTPTVRVTAPLAPLASRLLPTPRLSLSRSVGPNGCPTLVPVPAASRRVNAPGVRAPNSGYSGASQPPVPSLAPTPPVFVPSGVPSQ